MDDGEEEMGFDAFPCIISTGFFFDFFSGLVPIFHMHMHCLCLRMAHYLHYLSLKSGTRLLAGFPALVEFHKTWEEECLPGKMSFETVTVHGVNCLLRSISFPSHFHLKLWDQPSKGTESIVCFGFAALSIILYLMVQFLALLEIGLLVPLHS